MCPDFVLTATLEVGGLTRKGEWALWGPRKHGIPGRSPQAKRPVSVALCEVQSLPLSGQGLEDEFKA
jgi:hypothetical protein